MDSEHRHELKTNELADLIAHGPEFLRKNGLTIVVVVLAVAVVIFYKPVLNLRQAAVDKRYADVTLKIEQFNQNKGMAMQGGEFSSPETLLLAANTLGKSAEETKLPYLAAMAFIKRGEALRADLHYKSGEVERAIVLSQVELARKAYEQAIEKAAGNSTLVAKAKYGLALCAEEVGDFVAAQKIYENIMTDTELKETLFAGHAKIRIGVMEDNKEKFVFVESAPVPAEVFTGKGAVVGPVVGPVLIQEADAGAEPTEVEVETSAEPEIEE